MLRLRQNHILERRLIGDKGVHRGHALHRCIEVMEEFVACFAEVIVRWSPIFGQVVKLGSPFEGLTHGGQAEALLG